MAKGSSRHRKRDIARTLGSYERWSEALDGKKGGLFVIAAIRRTGQA
jgi:hypothetical protein